MKNNKKMTSGITLIALVVTIIVLLILAGISISMLSGNNGILKKATDAKTGTVIGQEKEALSLAYNSCMVNKETKNEDITDLQLKNELSNNGYKDTAVQKSGNKFKATFNSGNVYIIKHDGTINKYEKVEPTAIYAKLYTDGTLILSSTDYIDETRTIAEDGDYGDVSQKTNYYQETMGEPKLIGDFPGWIDEKVYGAYNSKIKKVIVYDKIVPTNMSYWFQGCTELNEINGLEKIDTSNVTDMTELFEFCSVLNTINTSNFDTSKVTNMAGMFSGCSNLQNIDLSGFDTSKVTNMSGMFSGCNNLQNIDLSDFNTSKVTYMNGMFSGCTELANINVSSFNTSNVISMSYMFYNCSSLSNLNLDTFSTSNVEEMRYMFYGCNNLKTLSVVAFDTSKVKNMDAMFDSCSGLTVLDLSNFNTIDVVLSSYGGTSTMFRNVNARVMIGSNWNPSMTETATGYNGIFEVKNN